MAPDEDLEKQLNAYYAGEAADHVFRLVLAPLEAFPEIEAASFYAEHDRLAEHDLVIKRAECYRGGDEAGPIVFCWEEYASPRLLDGFHTASAAREAGLTHIDAYELLDWEWRPPRS